MFAPERNRRPIGVAANLDGSKALGDRAVTQFARIVVSPAVKRSTTQTTRVPRAGLDEGPVERRSNLNRRIALHIRAIAHAPTYA